MAAAYPNSIKSFTALNPGDTVLDTHPELAYDEITAMQTALLSTGLAHHLFPDSTVNARSLGKTTSFFGQAYLKGLTLGASAELTVAAGVVTVTPGVFRVDTESDAASDDLDTLTAGTGVVENSIVILRAEDASRVVTLKDGTGNLLLSGDFILNATDKTIAVYYDGSNFRELSRSGDSGGDSVRVLSKDVIAATVENTTTETTVFTYTVPGNTLGTTKALRLKMVGDHLQNHASNDQVTIRVKYGSTTIFSSAISVAQHASRRAVALDCEMSAMNSDSAQSAYGVVVLGGIASAAGAGVAATTFHTGVLPASSEDSTSDAALVVTVQLQTSNALISFRAHTTTLELLP